MARALEERPVELTTESRRHVDEDRPFWCVHRLPPV
jgi:hypothetical protein